MLPTNEKAPVYCTKTITINASPDSVWKVISDIDHWNKYFPSISKSNLNGELKPGTTFDWKNGGTKIHSTLHTVKPFTNFGWTGKAFTLYAIHNYVFKEVNGKTEVTTSESMQGFLGKLFKKSLNKTLEAGTLKSLEELKKACEDKCMESPLPIALVVMRNLKKNLFHKF